MSSLTSSPRSSLDNSSVSSPMISAVRFLMNFLMSFVMRFLHGFRGEVPDLFWLRVSVCSRSNSRGVYFLLNSVMRFLVKCLMSSVVNSYRLPQWWVFFAMKYMISCLVSCLVISRWVNYWQVSGYIPYRVPLCVPWAIPGGYWKLGLSLVFSLSERNAVLLGTKLPAFMSPWNEIARPDAFMSNLFTNIFLVEQQQ